MVFIVAYIVAFWALALIYRRRWPAFTALLVSVPMTMLFAHLFVTLTPMVGPKDAPSPDWMYFVGAGMEGFILIVGITLAVQPRRRVDTPCKRCRYDLAGVTRGRCPECGRAIDPRFDALRNIELSPSLISNVSPTPRQAPASASPSPGAPRAT